MTVAALLPVKTTIYVGVRAEDAAAATRRGVQVYSALISRLYQENPMVQGIRVDMEEPMVRKEEESVFDCAGYMRAEIPDSTRTLAQDNALDAWRDITRITLRDVTRPMVEGVFRATTFVAMSRLIIPGEEAKKAASTTTEAPKKLITIEAVVAGQERKIEIPDGENLLDGCLDKDVKLKWDCKNGVCDSCRVKVHSGMENLSEVTSGEENMLGDLLKQGYRLSCQVTCKGPVKIEQSH